MSENQRPFRKFQRRSFKRKSETIEEKIKNFILRNSKNGYFTRVPTLAYKFEIPHKQAWDVVGTLLSEDIIESYHDTSGEMKLCSQGESYKILQNSHKRPKSKSKKFKKH